MRSNQRRCASTMSWVDIQDPHRLVGRDSPDRAHGPRTSCRPKVDGCCAPSGEIEIADPVQGIATSQTRRCRYKLLRSFASARSARKWRYRQRHGSSRCVLCRTAMDGDGGKAWPMTIVYSLANLRKRFAECRWHETFWPGIARPCPGRASMKGGHRWRHGHSSTQSKQSRRVADSAVKRIRGLEVDAHPVSESRAPGGRCDSQHGLSGELAPGERSSRSAVQKSLAIVDRLFGRLCGWCNRKD